MPLPAPSAWLPLLFGLSRPVSRRTYLVTGLMLAALKLGLDALVIHASTGQLWSPLAYLHPSFSEREALLQGAPSWLLWALAAASLPFTWVGLSMSLRRAVDAGASAWVGLLFLVPVLNYALILVLCLLPTCPTTRCEHRQLLGASVDLQLRSALAGVVAGVLFALGMVVLSAHVLGVYGGALFLGTPVAMGAMSGYALNRRAHHSAAATVGVAALTVLLAGGALLLVALEGLACLLMALPPALAASALGALFGRAVAHRGEGPSWPALLVLLVVPVLAGAEAGPRRLPLREVVSSIEIDAPPERVWPQVVGFGELPAATPLVFRLGVAAPRRARIEGAGVGAVRHCEFTTGPFVEPITRWEPPLRLSFDVTAQPPPMREWSPYRYVSPPHLDSAFRSRRGEFRLIPLPGGRTRLEGSTWYELDLAPTVYWSVWSDALVHAIHLQVLAHIKRLVEG